MQLVWRKQQLPSCLNEPYESRWKIWDRTVRSCFGEAPVLVDQCISGLALWLGARKPDDCAPMCLEALVCEVSLVCWVILSMCQVELRATQTIFTFCFWLMDVHGWFGNRQLVFFVHAARVQRYKLGIIQICDSVAKGDDGNFDVFWMAVSWSVLAGNGYDMIWYDMIWYDMIQITWDANRSSQLTTPLCEVAAACERSLLCGGLGFQALRQQHRVRENHQDPKTIFFCRACFWVNWIVAGLVGGCTLGVYSHSCGLSVRLCDHVLYFKEPTSLQVLQKRRSDHHRKKDSNSSIVTGTGSDLEQHEKPSIAHFDTGIHWPQAVGFLPISWGGSLCTVVWTSLVA